MRLFSFNAKMSHSFVFFLTGYVQVDEKTVKFPRIESLLSRCSHHLQNLCMKNQEGT